MNLKNTIKINTKRRKNMWKVYVLNKVADNIKLNDRPVQIRNY